MSEPVEPDDQCPDPTDELLVPLISFSASAEVTPAATPKDEA